MTKMLKIFILSSIDFRNGNSAGANRCRNYSKALQELGHCVSLICLSDNIFYDKSTKKVTSSESLFNQKLPFLSSLFFPFLIAFNLVKLAFYLRNLNSVRIIVYPSTKVAVDFLSLVVFKFFSQNKLYYEFNEIRKYSCLNYYYSENSVVKVFEFVQNRYKWIKFQFPELLLKYYDGIICISRNIAHYAEKYNKNIVIIPILTSSDSYSDSFPVYDKNKPFIICFSGSLIVKKEGLDSFFEALSLLNLRFESFEFHLYGKIEKNERNLLVNKLPKVYVIEEKIKFLGDKNQNDLLTLLREKHLLVVPRPLTPQNNYGFSTKITDYLLAGVPILLTDVSDNPVYFKDNFNGFMVAPGDPKIMAEKILFIISNYDTIAPEIVKNANNTVVKQFYYKSHSANLEKFLQ